MGPACERPCPHRSCGQEKEVCGPTSAYNQPSPKSAGRSEEKAAKTQGRDEARSRTWATHCSVFEDAERRNDVEAMHRVWTNAVAETIAEATGAKGLNKYHQAAERAVIAKFVIKAVQAETDDICSVTTCRQRKLNHFAARVSELRGQTFKEAKCQEQSKFFSNQAAAQRDRLWNNIVATVIEAEPCAQLLVEGRGESTPMPEVGSDRGQEGEAGSPRSRTPS